MTRCQSKTSQNTIFLNSHCLPGSDDYSTMPNIFISIANSPINDSESRRSCITVDAQEDSEVEGMEELYVHLGYASFFQDVNRVIIQPNRTTLEIIDQSSKIHY